MITSFSIGETLIESLRTRYIDISIRPDDIVNKIVRNISL